MERIYPWIIPRTLLYGKQGCARKKEGKTTADMAGRIGRLPEGNGCKPGEVIRLGQVEEDFSSGHGS